MFSPIVVMVLSPKVLWSIWGIVFIASLVLCWILVYHFNHYGPDNARGRRFKIIYIIGNILLLFSAATFILSL